MWGLVSAASKALMFLVHVGICCSSADICHPEVRVLFCSCQNMDYFFFTLKLLLKIYVFWSYGVFSSNLWKQFRINLYHHLHEIFRLCCPCGGYVVLDAVIWQTICRIYLHTLKWQPWRDWPQFVCRSVSFVSHNCFLLWCQRDCITMNLKQNGEKSDFYHKLRSAPARKKPRDVLQNTPLWLVFECFFEVSFTLGRFSCLFAFLFADTNNFVLRLLQK